MPNSEVLANLRDIQLPAPINWWPPAPGWYFLTIAILLIVIGLLYYVVRRYRHGLAKREALRLLERYKEDYQRDGNSQSCSMQVSELLRRVALAYYPREDVAGLRGEHWIVFLNTTSKGVDFNKVRSFLLVLPYQPPQTINLNPLFKCAQAWIKQRRVPCLN